MEATTVQINLRPAAKSDFKNEFGVWLYGTFFWLKSQHTGEFEGPYLFDETRDITEFIDWYGARMVWVRK